MRARLLSCGLVVLSPGGDRGSGGSVTSGGSRYAVAESDGETVIETCANGAEALARAYEIAQERAS